MSNFYKNMSPERALEKAMRYCSFQERCVVDVENKFRSWNLRKENWDKIIDQLMELDFLNETRYIEAFVRGKFNMKKWGRVKIKAQLHQKGIFGEAITKAIDSEILIEDYLKTIEGLVLKKRVLLTTLDKKTQNEKLHRYLIGKGYENELVFKYMNL